MVWRRGCHKNLLAGCLKSQESESLRAEQSNLRREKRLLCRFSLLAMTVLTYCEDTLLDDRARAGMKRLSGDLPAARQTEKHDRCGHVFRLRDAVEQVLQGAARSHSLQGLGVAEHLGHRRGGDARGHGIDVDVMGA